MVCQDSFAQSTMILIRLCSATVKNKKKFKKRVIFNKRSIKALKEKAASEEKKMQMQCWPSGDWADKPTGAANVYWMKISEDKCLSMNWVQKAKWFVADHHHQSLIIVTQREKKEFYLGFFSCFWQDKNWISEWNSPATKSGSHFAWIYLPGSWMSNPK